MNDGALTAVLAVVVALVIVAIYADYWLWMF